MENESQRSAQWDPKILKDHDKFKKKKGPGVPRGGLGHSLKKNIKNT